jgi:uncharacterized protein YcbX
VKIAGFMPIISQLYIYPIKSLGGIELDKATITTRGLQFDRRFMLVDDNNSFITQRRHSKMALFRTAIKGENLFVHLLDDIGEKLSVPLVPEPSVEIAMVTIRDDCCEAQFVSDEADKWFSTKLGISCRLVYMPESTLRKVDIDYAIDGDITSFSDGFQVLLIGESSLGDLNSRLEKPLPMNRFRPNIVMRGGLPFEEDTMEEFSINGIDFCGVKLCSRCVVPTIDQETGLSGREPSTTLATYRSYSNKVFFGQNVLCRGDGMVRIGDEIRIMKTKPSLL